MKAKMKGKPDCFDFIREYDSAGEPVWGRRCFCGTTACLEQRQITFGKPLPEVEENEIKEISRIIYDSL